MSGAVRIRRILVALDVSPGSLAAAEVAVELAALLEAELLGLFVEDPELLNLSSSPLARQVDFLTASPSGLEAGAVEQQLRVHAVRARRALERIAGRAGIPWTFRVARGAVAREIVVAAAEVDLVSLGRLGWSVRRKRLLGKTARALVAQPNKVTLLSERRMRIRPPVVVLYDGSEVGLQALALAAQLALRLDGPLHVLLVGEDESKLRAEIAGQVDERATDVWIERIGRPDPARISRVVCHQMGGVVVVPLGRAPLDEENLQQLLDEVRCPVLAVS